MKRYRFTVLLILVLTACNFNVNASYKNEENEKEDAESTVALFYKSTERNDINNVMNLFSNSFYKISDRNKFKKFLTEKKVTLGEFKSYVLDDWKTNRVEGTDSKTESLLIYKVEYSKLSSRSLGYLQREADSAVLQTVPTKLSKLNPDRSDMYNVKLIAQFCKHKCSKP